MMDVLLLMFALGVGVMVVSSVLIAFRPISANAAGLILAAISFSLIAASAGAGMLYGLDNSTMCQNQYNATGTLISTICLSGEDRHYVYMAFRGMYPITWFSITIMVLHSILMVVKVAVDFAERRRVRE